MESMFYYWSNMWTLNVDLNCNGDGLRKEKVPNDLRGSEYTMKV